jgi:hypothetical protein
MPIYDLFENSENDVYNNAAQASFAWKTISHILARRLVRGSKGGISPCPDKRTRVKCLKISKTPPDDQVCVQCLIEHAQKTLKRRKKYV